MAPVVKNASTARTRTPNILVVDDEPTLHELVGDIVGGTIPCKLVAAKTVDEAKKILATEATALVHGRDAADRAEDTARATFEQGVIAASLPTVEVKRAELKKGVGVLNASLLAGFVQSTGEARRQIKGGGLKVNDEAVSDERRLLTLSDLTEDGVIKLSLGKKRHVLIRPV